MKDLGEAAYILGIKIYRYGSRHLIGLSQTIYLDKVLKRFKMENSKEGSLPYDSAIGSIMYAMICTRPDVSYALSVTSRYQSDPGKEHWTAVKMILKYLRITKNMFLDYGGDEQLIVKGYSDESFTTNLDDFKSQSGYVFTLNRGVVSWKSSKQDTVADSTIDAEHIAAAEAAKEGVWMKKFVTELGVVPCAIEPKEIYCDNNGAIAQAKEPRSYQKNKHVQRRFYLIRQLVNDGDIKMCKIHTDLNVSYPLPLPLAKQEQHQTAICVC
jgi:hypothetical protein